MARMQPEAIPSDREVTKSERALFEALRDGLCDEFWVYHSLPYIAPERARQGEADFLILHPDLGMLVVECKGYGVRRRFDGTWVREHYGKEKELRRSPIEQVKAQLEELVDTFNKPMRKVLPHFHGRFPMLRGWALAFPFTRWNAEQIPPDLHPETVLTADDLTQIEEAIRRAFAFHARRFDRREPPRLTAEEFHRFRLQVVSPRVELVPNLAGAIEMERATLLRLTKEQARVARMLLANRRLRVPGAAGTGKTVLAQHGALMLAAEGKDVMLVCFNRHLRDHLRTSIGRLPSGPGRIYVASFHSLCAHAHWALFDRPMAVPERMDEAGEFWVEQAPGFLLEALQREVFDGWDAIIVDEGQDFARSWWNVLEAALRDESSTMAVFYDEHQAIFDHGDQVPDFPAVFPLVENFRNTKSITGALNELELVELHPHRDCPRGEPPCVYEQATPLATRRTVGELLHRLLHTEKLRCDQVVILTPHSPQNSSLGDEGRLGSCPIVYDPGRRDDGVLHTTISAFKGLEADTVIMVDVDPMDARCNVNARYVAASRAQHRLHVLQKRNWLEAV